MPKLNFLRLKLLLQEESVDLTDDVISRCIQETSDKLSITFDEAVDVLLSEISQIKESILDKTLKDLSNITFRPHQIEVAEAVLDNKTTVVCHDVGTGKTLTSILSFESVLRLSQDKFVIILAPETLQENMKNEMIRVGLDPDEMKTRSSSGRIYKLYNFITYEKFTDIYFGVGRDIDGKRVVSYETSVDEVEDRLNIGSRLLEEENIPPLQECIFVLEEAHKIRTDYTYEFTPFKIFRKDTSFYSRAACVLECSSLTYKNICLTATPMYNAVSNINNFLSMIYGLNRPMDVKRYSRIMFGGDDMSGFFKKHFLFKTNTFTSGKGEGSYLENFPRVIQRNVLLKMGEDYEERYMEFQEAKETNIDYGQSESNAFLSKMRQATNEIGEGIFIDEIENPKVEYIKRNFLTDSTSASSDRGTGFVNKTVICSNFVTKGIKLVQSSIEEADEEYLEVIGTNSKRAINKAIKLYNSDASPSSSSRRRVDPPRFLFISPAGGEGITLKGVRHKIIYEPSWNRNTDRQFEGRGVRYKSHSHLPPEERTITIHRLILCKRKNFDRLTKALESISPGVQLSPSVYIPDMYPGIDEQDINASTPSIFSHDLIQSTFADMKTKRGLLKPSVELHLLFMGISKDEKIIQSLKRLGKQFD